MMLRAECHLVKLTDSSANIWRKITSHGTDQAEGVAGDLGVEVIKAARQNCRGSF